MPKKLVFSICRSSYIYGNTNLLTSSSPSMFKVSTLQIVKELGIRYKLIVTLISYEDGQAKIKYSFCYETPVSIIKRMDNTGDMTWPHISVCEES